jgi:hypothetical protein
MLALRGNALAGDFLAVGVEHNAFDFRPAEINADAIHGQIGRKDEGAQAKKQPHSYAGKRF